MLMRILRTREESYQTSANRHVSTHITEAVQNDKQNIQEGDQQKSGTTDRESRPESSGFKRLIKRFGVAGFLFFFIKGLVLYILIPLGLFKWFGGC